MKPAVSRKLKAKLMHTLTGSNSPRRCVKVLTTEIADDSYTADNNMFTRTLSHDILKVAKASDSKTVTRK